MSWVLDAVELKLLSFLMLTLPVVTLNTVSILKVLHN